MRKAIRAAATAQNDARFHRLPKSKSVIWQQITSGKHYSDEFVSRGILQPWVQVITELAREAAKTHYKDKKLHGKIERIHVDQGIDRKRYDTHRYQFVGVSSSITRFLRTFWSL